MAAKEEKRTSDPTSRNSQSAASSMTISTDRPILLVEEDLPLRTLIRTLLEDEGLVVVEASNGWEAVAHLCRTGPRFAVVVLDVELPVMNGVEVMRRMQADEQLQRLPVIALTSRPRGDLPGAPEVFCKPFDMDALLGAIHERLPQLHATSVT